MRATYDPGPVVSRYAAVLCEEIACQWCMRYEEQQAAANLAPALQAEVLSRCPTHALLRHYAEIFDVDEHTLQSRYVPLVTRGRWKALCDTGEDEHKKRPRILPRHFTTQWHGWQCMAIAPSGDDDRGIYFASTEGVWMMDNECDEHSWRKIADIPQHAFGYDSWGLAGMVVRATERTLFMTTTGNRALIRCDLSGSDGGAVAIDLRDTRYQTIGWKATFHSERMMLQSSLCGRLSGLWPRPIVLEIRLNDIPGPNQHDAPVYVFEVECVRMYWFHSETWIGVQNDVGTFRVVHVPYLLARAEAAGYVDDYNTNGQISFSVIPLEESRMHKTYPNTNFDQFVITDDGKLIVNSSYCIAVFQLDPSAREGRHIKTISSISFEYPWLGMAYSMDPKQKLIILANGVSDSLTLFDVATLDYVGTFHCDTMETEWMATKGAGSYVHRKRHLNGKPSTTACKVEFTLNVLQLSHGNFAHIMFDRNRLILCGRNHYYMYTVTLGPPPP